MLIPQYLPGFRAGGPARSIAGLVDHLGHEIEIYILCRDRDLGDTGPYENVPIESWTELGKSKVYYVAGDKLPLLAIGRAVRRLKPHVLYLNSIYSLDYCILPLLVRRIVAHQPAVVLAPRGSLCPGAMGLKTAKKKIFIALAKLIRLFDGVTWQASSDEEARDIRREMGSVSIMVAPNLVAKRWAKKRELVAKQSGSAQLLFLSRISPKKNLLGALKLLEFIKGCVSLTIAGPIEDRNYWGRCKNQIAKLPANVSVDAVGPVPFPEASAIFARHHLLLFPTLSENYGHVIAEALSTGTPVLISDQTPWRNLQRDNAGWDIDLGNTGAMQRALQSFIDLDDEGFRLMSNSARLLAEKQINDAASIAANRELFGL